mmetsp:Transcript_13522/g.25869  ORF Transcript_13522/g.25869 Transcript_13522/m.25869 type:complete len:219 (+) Transcript_13522:3112-3768(+)
MRMGADVLRLYQAGEAVNLGMYLVRPRQLYGSHLPQLLLLLLHGNLYVVVDVDRDVYDLLGYRSDEWKRAGEEQQQGPSKGHGSEHENERVRPIHPSTRVHLLLPLMIPPDVLPMPGGRPLRREVLDGKGVVPLARENVGVATLLPSAPRLPKVGERREQGAEEAALPPVLVVPVKPSRRRPRNVLPALLYLERLPSVRVQGRPSSQVEALRAPYARG